MASKKKAMNPALLSAVASQFRVLAEPARLTLLQELLSGERSVGGLVRATGMSQANTSKHLAVLAEAGFLARRKEGTTVYYAVVDPSVNELCDLMCTRVQRQAQADAAALVARRR